MTFIAHAHGAPPFYLLSVYIKLRDLSLEMKLFIVAVALLVVGFSPSPGSGQTAEGPGDGTWLARPNLEVYTK